MYSSTMLAGHLTQLVFIIGWKMAEDNPVPVPWNKLP